MKNTLFILLISSLILGGCQGNKELASHHSFLKNNHLPDKPSFSHLLAYSDYYFSSPFKRSLALTEDHSDEKKIDSLNHKLKGQLQPNIVLQTGFSPYFGGLRFPEYYNYLNNNNLLNFWGSSHTNTGYYSQYYHGNYWGSGGIAPSDGTLDFVFPKLNDDFAEFVPEKEVLESNPQSQIIAHPKGNKIVFSRPQQGQPAKKQVKVNYLHRYSVNKITQSTVSNSSGIYNDPKPIQAVYYVPSTSSPSNGHRSGISGGGSSRPSSSGYRPRASTPRSSSGGSSGGGGRSGGGNVGGGAQKSSAPPASQGRSSSPR